MRLGLVGFLDLLPYRLAWCGCGNLHFRSGSLHGYLRLWACVSGTLLSRGFHVRFSGPDRVGRGDIPLPLAPFPGVPGGLSG